MSAVEGAEPAVTTDQQPETSEALRDSNIKESSKAGEQADEEADSPSKPGISIPTEQNVDMAPDGVEGRNTDLKVEETKPLPSTLQVDKPDEDSLSEGTDVYEEDTSWRHVPDDKNLVERRKKAPKRVKQYSDYIKLMEDRMAAMEDQLRKLNPEPPAPEPAPEPKEAPAPDATGDSSDPPPPPAPPRQLQLGIARLKWDQFDKIGTSGKYVIDVLIGDPDYMKPRQRKKGAKQTEKYNTTDDKDKKAANNEKKEENESTQPRSASASEKRSLLPERMCINSDLLVKMLNEITLLNMVGPLVIIRPFKVLVNWETEIRQRLEVLEQKEADAVAAKAKEAESLKREEEEQTEEKTENHVESTVSAEPSIEKTNKIIETTKSVSDEKQTEGEQIKDSHDGGSKTENVQANNNTVTEKDPGPKLSEEERKGQSSHADEVAEYDELDADIYSTDGKPALKRLRLLVKFMDEEISGPLKKLKEARRHQQVFFADLYHFFVPGDEVYGNLGSGTTEKVQAYRILQCTGGRRYNLSEKSKEQTDSLDGLSSMGSPLVVTCIHIDFNGKEFGPVTTTFPIPEYLGERSTSSLPIWPLAFMEEPQDLKRGLELRGKRFIELAQVSHKEYTGLTIDPKEDIDSQIIVDFETAFQYNPDWTPDLDIKYPATSDPRETAALSADDNNVYEGKGIVLDSYENEYSYTHEDATIDQTRMEDYKEDHPIFRRDLPVLLKATQNGVELNDDDKRLLPRRVFGFVLRSRTWASISIHLVRDLPIKQDGFDQLVLPDGHRDLVRALVKTHSRGSRPAYGSVETDHQVDLVKGKGKGLIILLHGVPGVGKTSTAECIADYTQRPLFPITCGDIGETATAVEANLGKNFQLAHKWGCVLLLDEADVFMAKRSGSDIQRNSLVSVFLRVLEYYSGILFLTTNRVGIFDPAFKSRIHISLYYPPLNGITTIKIWKVNIERTRASGKSYEIDEDAIIDFARSHFLAHDQGGRWNGRQIRNAFQTAIALAEFDATEEMHRQLKISDAKELPPPRARITVDHFRKVASAASGFDRYLREVYGGRDESDRAFTESLRKDDYGEQPIASMRPPIRGNHSGGYHQPIQSRQQPQQQRSRGREPYYSDPPFDDSDPFQESKHPVLPNEVDNFARPSPDPRMMNRVDRGGYDQFGAQYSSNPQSPWSTDARSGGSATGNRIQHGSNGRARNVSMTRYEGSEFRMETTNEFGDFDEPDHGDGRGLVRDGRDAQGKVLAY